MDGLLDAGMQALELGDLFRSPVPCELWHGKRPPWRESVLHLGLDVRALRTFRFSLHPRDERPGAGAN